MRLQFNEHFTEVFTPTGTDIFGRDFPFFANIQFYLFDKLFVILLYSTLLVRACVCVAEVVE